MLRKGEEKDLPAILKLIKELAVYEKAENEVEVTESEMQNWGFGNDKIFEFFIIEENQKIVGLALYYYKYSTWKGKCLFLEDIIVTESCRGKGYGKILFEAVAKVAKEKKVRRMEWQVLEWNEPAIQFYKKYKAVLDPEWVNGKLTFEQIQKNFK
jgi:N-acetylglutamate synthase-like GNAT family acetyltransferase